jgi:uncharacterized damage-inducible protein DinB
MCYHGFTGIECLKEDPNGGLQAIMNIKFESNKSFEVLERTPGILKFFLNDLSNEWIKKNEGSESWSPYDIIGHLIHGEKTDWIPRAKIILSGQENRTFVPFDRFAQLREDQNRKISDMLQEFEDLRNRNLNFIKALELTDEMLERTGNHPEFGTVNLRQLLSTWVVHDLNHIAQICRVMSKQLQYEVGPWKNYLGILNK